MDNLVSNTREKQIEKLKQDKKRLQTMNEEKWNKKYKLAKAYYEHYENLEVKAKFKTINGYEYDENGINLGDWIYTQRRAYKEQGNSKITEEQIELLNQIGMRFETNKRKKEWDKKYKLAKAYYEYYGDLGVPANFKTTNGYEYDENGINLGDWISNQRIAYKGQGSNRITEEQIELLEQIEMRFNTRNKEEEWDKKYKLAKAYYEHYGDLEVLKSFKTINGYEYDGNGINLGTWITTQRNAYNRQGSNKITEEQIELLEQIGMRFNTRNKEEEWNKKYELAKAYYEHYGDLEVLKSFKTINGYEYDGNGINLGTWITTQRNAYNRQGSNKITEEQIELLEQIGMRFNTRNKEEEWNKKYELAKAYYEHHGDLEIPTNFKTINGYEYDESGVALGIWIFIQRQAYKGQVANKITKEQIELLEQIGMRFNTRNKEEEWNKKYELAKAYYEHHGDLEIPTNFKTINGYEYDESGVALGIWISTQRQAFKGQKDSKLDEERIKLLNQIGMKWFSENMNMKLQKEELNEKNIKRKKTELYNRFIEYLNKYKNDELPSKEEINSKFIKKLDRL